MANKIGTAPNQIPVHGHLGGMAYQDPKGVNITGGKVGGVDVASLNQQLEDKLDKEGVAASATKLAQARKIAGKSFDGSEDIEISYESLTDKPEIPTKADLGLDNVDNTADLDKPVSTAMQSALDQKLDKEATATAADKLANARTIAGKPFDGTADITLAPADVGAAPANHTHTAADIGAAPASHTHTPASIGAAPTSHTHTAAQVSGLHAVATSGSYNDLANKPTIPSLPTLATVATSGSYNDLANRPTIPAAVPTATAAQVRSASGAAAITADLLASASAPPGVLNGSTTTVAFNWAALISDNVTITANRTLANPTNVTPGTTRSITVKGSSATARTLAFGSNYKGNLPTVSVTTTKFTTLFLYAVDASTILVNAVEWS